MKIFFNNISFIDNGRIETTHNNSKTMNMEKMKNDEHHLHTSRCWQLIKKIKNKLTLHVN